MQWVRAAARDPREEAIAAGLEEANEAFRRVRRGLQGMGSRAGVAVSSGALSELALARAVVEDETKAVICDTDDSHLIPTRSLLASIHASSFKLQSGGCLSAMMGGGVLQIEPAEQTRVLDATMALPGVVFAGVPGAGGHDAVFAVVIGKRSWEGVDSCWGEAGILTLDTAEDSEGLRMQAGVRGGR